MKINLFWGAETWTLKDIQIKFSNQEMLARFYNVDISQISLY